MRMATITLPKTGNDGLPLTAAHLALQGKLLDNFGGYSMLPDMVGAWRDPNSGRVYHDVSTVYHVAISAADEPRVRVIALETGRAAAQLSIMVSMPSGEIEFINITPVRAAA